MAKRSSGNTTMTTDAVARIYSATAKAGDGSIPAESFAARAARAAAVNAKTTKGK